MASPSKIKKEIFNLFQKYVPSKNDGEISNMVDMEMRKLCCFNKKESPTILVSEREIEDKMRAGNVIEASICEMKSLIKNIKKTNIRDPAGLICFLNHMSNFGTESSLNSTLSSRHIQTILRIQQQDNRTSTPLIRSNLISNRLAGSDISSIGSNRSIVQKEELVKRVSGNQINSVDSQRNNANTNIARSSHNYQISNELTEFTLIGELLFIILGTNGQWLEWNSVLNQLYVRNGAILPYSMYEHVLTLIHCGTAYRRIKEYIEHSINNPTVGVVYQGLCVALNDHMKAYITLVASLQSQYNCWAYEIENKVINNRQNHLTLEILILKLHKPMLDLFFLANLLTNASDLRGGQLASALHWHLLHGPPAKVKITQNLLLHAVEPFYNFVQQWIYDGVLDQSNQEFFVAINQNYDFNVSWTDKYGLRTQMIPHFITESEAQKILLTGKSINFLREICGEKNNLKSQKEITVTMSVTAETMINQAVDRSFENMINSVYTVTSKHLLKVMFDKYQLMDHFKALRKYMLHGQGDFILRMIEIIGPELSKPADELKSNHFGGPLEMAIKSTNAQFDSREILDRLRISFLRISENESGWDVFTLNYQISDIRALEAVIYRSSFLCYLRAFNILFRSRRVHFILNNFIKERNSSHRAFCNISEVSGVLHFSHVMVMDMLHFVNQIQYYINFEVLECSWKKFMDSISKATDLDSVMQHHEYFLKQVTSRCLLESETRELLSNLRTIYDLIISFESILDEMFSKFHDELRQRQSYQEHIMLLKRQGTWGVDEKREKKEAARMTNFTKTEILKFHNKLKAHNNQYESHLVKFLSTIMDHNDSNLRCLYANLDFNGRYKDRIRDYRKKP